MIGLPPLPTVKTETLPVEDTTPEYERSGVLSDNEQSFILDAELTKRRRHDTTVLKFIDSFIRCKNIKQASDEVGISPTLGYRIRHYFDVSNAITKLIDRSAIKYGFDASEIMERTKEMIDFDPIEVYRADGTFKSNMYEISPEARRNIKKLKVRNLYSEQEDMNGMKKKIIIGEVIEYEFYDKQKAIELAGKEKDMFKTTTKVVHDVTNNMADILLSSAKRGQETALEYGKRVAVEAEFTESNGDEQTALDIT